MCGIFGIVSSSPVSENDLGVLVKHSQQRGRDSSGLLTFGGEGYHAYRADYPITRLLKEVNPQFSHVVLGHSRLITNGLADNQPVVRDDICVFHNGIVVNDEAIWPRIRKTPELQIDTEVIAGIAAAHLEEGGTLEDMPGRVLSLCRGVVACALMLPRQGKLCLFSNNGSLYVGRKEQGTYFASERYPLTMIDCEEIEQVRNPFR